MKTKVDCTKELQSTDTNDLSEMLDRVSGWIEKCDSKVSIILSGIGIIVGILLSKDYVVKIKEICCFMIDEKTVFSYIFLVLYFLSIIAICVGCVSLIFVLFARIRSDEYKSKKVKPDSLLFFGAIAQNKTFTSYRDKCTKWSEKEKIEDYISQIYICSLICSKKYKFYNRGLIIIIIRLIVFAFLGIIGALIV